MPAKLTALKTKKAVHLAKRKTTVLLLVFDALPDSALIRESQLASNYKKPCNPAPLPFRARTLWRKAAARTFPRPTKLSERVTFWKVGKVRSWIAVQVGHTKQDVIELANCVKQEIANPCPNQSGLKGYFQTIVGIVIGLSAIFNSAAALYEIFKSLTGF